MELLQHVHSETEFQKELIDRFFHYNSYFFHCVSYHLDCELDGNANASNEDYLLFGNLMDKLVNSQNKVSELEALARIAGFDKFYKNLVSTIKYLRDADLDQEQMKIEIESLAQLLVDTAIVALHSNKTRDPIKQFLGIKIGEPDYETSESVKEAEEDNKLIDDINDTITQIDDQGLSTFGIHQEMAPEAREHKSNLELAEPPSEVSELAESEVTLETLSDFSESGDKEERDILQNMPGGKDASVEDALDTDLTEEGGSAFSTPQRSSENIEGIHEQPESIIQAFINKIEFQLNDLKNTLTLLKEHPEAREPWLNCINIFDNIKETAMISGLEAFEQIASKAQKYIITVLKEPVRNSDFHVTLLTETKNVLRDMIQEDLEAIDDDIIKNLMQKFNRPKSEEPKENSDFQDTLLTKPPKDLDLEVERNETSSASPILKGHEFKLPGEDDEEILNFVREVTNNNQNDKTQTRQDLIAEEMEKQNNAKEDEFSVTGPEGIHKVLEDDFPQSPVEKLKLFKDEAELYFNVVDDALMTLALRPENKVALDELELASYSLYGLTVKLDLEPLGQLLEAIERLVKNIIARKSSLSKKEYHGIKDAFKCLRNLNRVEDTGRRQFIELLRWIQELNSAIQNESNGDLRFDSGSHVTEETNGETTTTNQKFRLKSKSSFFHKS